MKFLSIFLICFVLKFAFSKSPTPVAGNVKADRNTKMIIVGMRHGNRNPEKFLKDDPNAGKWGFEGPLQLTSIGKRQGFAVGKELRRRYGRIIPRKFNVDEVKPFSSGAERAQMTLQTCMAGLFPPCADKTNSSLWNKNLMWQPIPYKIDNPMLRMYSINECQPQKDAWKPIDDDNLPELKDILERKKDLIAYVAQQTGLNGSLSNMADVADNIITMHALGLKLPTWVTQSTMAGHEGQDIFDMIHELAESHQIQCAFYSPCRNLMGGLWLQNILDTLKAKKDNPDNKVKLIVYAAHTEVTLSVMRLMYMDEMMLETSAGFILEYRDQPAPSVRLLFHGPVAGNPDKREIRRSSLSEECEDLSADRWCPLDAWMDSMKQRAFANWQEKCKLQKCQL